MHAGFGGTKSQWIHPSISILSRILDARDYMLARTYDNVMNCNQKRTRPSAKLQTLTDPHILQKAVANMSLFHSYRRRSSSLPTLLS
jgi:hypothetical protein